MCGIWISFPVGASLFYFEMVAATLIALVAFSVHIILEKGDFSFMLQVPDTVATDQRDMGDHGNVSH